MNTDLTDIVTESLEDAAMPQEEAVETSEGSTTDEAVETSPEASSEATEASGDTGEVASPANRAAKTPDEFEKKFGVSSQSVTGRENRIPYSRVKAIVGKREKELQTQYENEYKPKLTEFETKIKGYEETLQRVGEFENVLMNEPEKMFEILQRIPAYAKYFQTHSQEQPAAQAAANPEDAFPEPKDKYGDGVNYNMDGVKALLDWNARQVESKVSKQYDDKFQQFQQKYSPIEEEWKAQQYMAQLAPKINEQITEARTWPLFTDNEAEIVKALEADRALSLDGAYRKVVFPKIQADRDSIRQSVIKDLQNAPAATAAPARSAKSVVQRGTGPRSLESVVSDAIRDIKR